MGILFMKNWGQNYHENYIKKLLETKLGFVLFSRERGGGEEQGGHNFQLLVHFTPSIVPTAASVCFFYKPFPISPGSLHRRYPASHPLFSSSQRLPAPVTTSILSPLFTLAFFPQNM